MMDVIIEALHTWMYFLRNSDVSTSPVVDPCRFLHAIISDTLGHQQAPAYLLYFWKISVPSPSLSFAASASSSTESNVDVVDVTN